MCIKGWLAISSLGEEADEQSERAVLSAGEMQFYLDESLDLSARMGEYNAVSPLAAVVNQWRKSGRRFLLLKREKKSLLHLKLKKKYDFIKCDKVQLQH